MATINGFNLPEETLDDKKYIYGTYLESAFHNFFSVMRHIYFMTLKKDIKETIDDLVDDVINGRNADKSLNAYKNKTRLEDFGNELYWTTFFQDLNSSKPEIKSKAVDLARKHFPFLEPFIDKSYTPNGPDKDTLCFVILEKLSKFVRLLRHEYSHYKLPARAGQIQTFNDNEKWVIDCLKQTFDASKRVVKTRFSYSDEQMKCAERFQVEKDFNHKDQNGRPGKKVTELQNYKYKIDREVTIGSQSEWHISAFGIVSVACLFLEKKYIQQFTDKLHCVSPTDKVIINEMLAVYRLLLPVNKLDSSNGRMALGLDILNELRKCPKELFELIEPKNQNLFRIQGDSEKGNEDILLVRNRDRFAYFLLKYIDEFRLFKGIRFQVSLGKYFYKFYNKRCIDSQEANRVRSLQKELNGFGRLYDIEKERNIRWKDLIRKFEEVHQNTAEESPYITDHHASYVFNGNRIGLWIPDEGNSDMLLPEIKPEGARCTPPSCWLSIYELPALAFLMYLTSGKNVEKIIKQKVKTYRKLFNEIAEGTLRPNNSEEELERILSSNYKGMKLRDIPKKLQDYLLCRNMNMEEAFNSWAKLFIDQLLNRTKIQLAHFKDDRKMEAVKIGKNGRIERNKQNKIGKKNYVEIKAGRLAGYIAKDFMTFQPAVESGENKLTGMNFQILQSSLATYQDGNFELIVGLLRSSKLIKNSDPTLDHPFLAKVVDKQPQNIYEFYSEYLKAKINYLKDCQEPEVDLKSLYFLHSNKAKWNTRDDNFYRALAARYMEDEYKGYSFEKSFELPRGLFEDAIRQNLSHSNNAYMKSIAQDEKYNISYLLYAFYLNDIEDDCQNIYLYPRSYKLFNKLDKKRPTDPAVYYEIEDIYNLIIKKDGVKPLDTKINTYLNDLRFNRTDKRTFKNLQEKKSHEREMLQSLLSSMKATERTIKQYKIQDMVLFLLAKDILKEALGDNQGKTGKLDRMMLQNVEPQLSTLNVTIPRFAIDVTSKDGTHKTIYQENLKLKNYSQFYRFLFDRRMPSLLNLTKESEIDRHLIESELDSYDQAHLDVLSDVISLEKDYGQNHPEADSYKFSDVVNGEPNENELREIRNSFAHATYTANLNEPKVAELPEKATSIRNKLRQYVESKN